MSRAWPGAAVLALVALGAQAQPDAGRRRDRDAGVRASDDTARVRTTVDGGPAERTQLDAGVDGGTAGFRRADDGPRDVAALDAGIRLAPTTDGGPRSGAVELDAGARRDGGLGPDAGVSRSDPAWKKNFLLSRAGDAYARNKFDEAATLFRSVLKLEPGEEVSCRHLAAIAMRRNELLQAAVVLDQGVTAHPKSYALRHDLGAVLLQQSRPAEAVLHFMVAAEVNPTSVDAAVNWGDALKLSGRIQHAIDAYREAVKRDPTSGWAHRQLGYALFEAKVPAEAVVHLQEASTTFPKEAPLFLVMGHAALQDGQFAVAQRAYERAVALAPKVSDHHLFLGLSHEKQRVWPQAIIAYLKSAELAPKSAIPRVHLGNVYRTVGDFPRARAQYKQAGRHPWALAQLGFLELEAGNDAEAEKVLKVAALVAPDNAEVGEVLGDLAQKRKDWKAAEKEYRRVLKTNHRHLGSRVKLGDVLRTLGKPDAALDAYRIAAAQHPKSAWAQIAYGDGRRSKGQLPEAIQQYRWALDVEPTSAWARRQLGLAFFDAGDDAHAKTLLLELPEAVRAEPDVQVTLGHLARRENAPDRARLHYLAALNTNADHLGALVSLADLYRELGKPGDGLGLIRRATALAPDLKDAWTLRGDLAAIAYDTQRPVEPAYEDEAVTAYEKAMQLGPDDLRPVRQLGFFCFLRGRDAKASELLTRVMTANPTDVELPLTLGHLAARQKRLAEALGLYGLARTLAPRDIRPLGFLGATYRALDQLAESREVLEKAIALAEPLLPDGGISETLASTSTQLRGGLGAESAWVHLELGYTHFALRDSAKALASAETSVRLDPNNPEGWLFVSRMRQRRTLIAGAVEAAERAVAIDPTHALANRALASALLDRAEPGDFSRGLGAVTPFIEKLSGEALTFLVQGHLLARLSLAPGEDKPRGQFAQAKPRGQQEKERSQAIEAFDRALTLVKDDEPTQLSVGQGLVDLHDDDKARKTLEALVAKPLVACPKDEFSFEWSLPQSTRVELVAQSREEAARLERLARHARAHLLLGELAERAQQGDRARLQYACAITLAPDTAEAHLKLGLAYENRGMVRLAEEHVVAALQLNPGLTSARAAVERLRREAGFPIGPVRVAVEGSATSDPLPLEIAANVVRVTGVDATERERLLTVPRLLRFGAAAAYRPEERPDLPRFELQYDGLLGFGTFLTDRLQFENTVGHSGTLRSTGRIQLSSLRQAELTWRGAYRLLGATAPSRTELRHHVSGGARLVHLKWGTFDGQVEFERGDYQPAAGVTLVERSSNAIGGELRYLPLVPWRRLEGLATYRVRGVFLGSGRAWSSHRLDLDGLWRGDVWLGGGEINAGLATDRFPAGGPNVVAGSLGFLVKGGVGLSGYTFAIAKTGFTFTPGNSAFDAFRIGLDAQHRFFFRKGELSLALAAGYEFRSLYNARHLDHLFMATVTFGR